MASLPLAPDRGDRDAASGGPPAPAFRTALGILYQGDCTAVLPSLGDATVDTVFADPPFNLGKEYGRGVDDRRADDEYLAWCRTWIGECVRVLKPGGSFF